jgi:GT2 family glycosyltransferase
MRCEGGTEIAGYPTLAVIIVNWNRCRCLRDLLLDVQRQSHPADELIVVDNGSDDGSPEMVEREFRGVNLIRLRRNMGLSFGRNVGIEASGSELLMFADNDLRILDTSFLHRVRDSARSHLDCGLISFDIIGLSETGYCLRRNERLFGWDQLEAMVRDGIAPTPEPACYTALFAGGASLVRRVTFDRVGIFDSSLWYGGEEADLAFRCHRSGVRLILDRRLWVVHKHSPEMRPKSRDGTAWKNEAIVRARYMPVPDFVLALAFQVAQAFVCRGDIWIKLNRLVSIWSAVYCSLGDGFMRKRTPCCRSTMSRYYLLSIYNPECYDCARRLSMSPLRYWLLRSKDWFLKKSQTLAYVNEWRSSETGEQISCTTTGVNCQDP